MSIFLCRLLTSSINTDLQQVTPSPQLSLPLRNPPIFATRGDKRSSPGSSLPASPATSPAQCCPRPRSQLRLSRQSQKWRTSHSPCKCSVLRLVLFHQHTDSPFRLSAENLQALVLHACESISPPQHDSPPPTPVAEYSPELKKQLASFGVYLGPDDRPLIDAPSSLDSVSRDDSSPRRYMGKYRPRTVEEMRKEWHRIVKCQTRRISKVPTGVVDYPRLRARPDQRLLSCFSGGTAVSAWWNAM